MPVNWCTKVSENIWFYQKETLIHAYSQMVNTRITGLDHCLDDLYTDVDESSSLKTNS
jgi:hypothetical protein